MEKPQQIQQKNNDNRRVRIRRTPVARSRRNSNSNSNSSSRSSSNSNSNGRRPISSRCLLVRNLPKGFVAWSDLTDKNQPVRVRRMVYCESSHGSIMVEFASEKERNTILALHNQRRRRIRERRQQQQQQQQNQPPQEGNSSNTIIKPHAFEIQVKVERCASERFVKKVLLGSRRARTSMTDHDEQEGEPSPLLAGVIKHSTRPSSSSSSSLVRRCIVIRKCLHPGNDNAEEKDCKILEAPPYDRNIRYDDASTRSRDSNHLQQQQLQPSPMEIRSGNLCDVVVQGVTLKNKSNMMAAMVVELESEESVERLLLAEDAKQSSSETPTTLAIPVSLHPVKSERYAQLCFRNVEAPPRTAKKNRSTRNGNRANDPLEDDNEDSRLTEADETICVNKNGDCGGINGGTKQENIVVGTQTRNTKNQRNTTGGRIGRLPRLRHIRNAQSPTRVVGRTPKKETLEEQIRDLLAENDRLKAAARATESQEDTNTAAESSPEKEI